MSHKSIVKASIVGYYKKEYDFSNATCILPISVGQHYHENKMLDATINLIGDNFKSCVILVCDSLQRHTLELFINHPQQSDIHAYANQLGDEWLERTQHTINKLSIPYNIKRWDCWLQHKDYKKQKSLIDKMYCNDDRFRLAIQNSVNEFLTRCQKRMGNQFNYEEIFPSSLEYFKEECSIMSLWTNEQIDFEIYPGKRPDALVVAHEYFAKPNNLLT